MIKFFRKVRQNLLMENKTGKYFKYAIGEIILVIIGILIALQINNWKNYKTERETEKIILHEIQANLEYDFNDFEDNITHLKDKRTSSNALLKAIDNNSIYHDSLGYFFSFLNLYPRFSSKSSGYKLLQSKGLAIITNTELRSNITDLYEDRYKQLLSYENERLEYNKILLEEAMKSYIGNKKLTIDLKPSSLILTKNTEQLSKVGFYRNIRNYEDLKKDMDFHTMIKNVEIWSTVLAFTHINVKKDVIELIDQIKKEIEEK